MEMQDIFKIYIDRLKAEAKEVFEIEAEPSFLEIEEKELIFTKNIEISGSTYLAQDDLVIDLNIKIHYNMPCLVCNELVENYLFIEHFVQTIAIKTIRNSIFDFSLIVRNEILLRIPNFVECNLGNCKKRKEINQYLTKNSQQHFPFQGLEL